MIVSKDDFGAFKDGTPLANDPPVRLLVAPDVEAIFTEFPLIEKADPPCVIPCIPFEEPELCIPSEDPGPTEDPDGRSIIPVPLLFPLLPIIMRPLGCCCCRC